MLFEIGYCHECSLKSKGEHRLKKNINSPDENLEMSRS